MQFHFYIFLFFTSFMISFPAVSACNRDFHGVLCDYYESNEFQDILNDYLQKAENGDVKAQSELAMFYDIGTGVKQNNVEALKWYKLAAEHGDVSSQYFLGSIYQDRYGMSKLLFDNVEIDFNEALKWYKFAAEQGDVFAMFSLGVLYNLDLKDKVEALKWYKLAAENGDEDAQKSYDELKLELENK